MVETISPVVHGGNRRRYWSSILLHALGATSSAAAFGAALGALGGLLGAPWGRAGLISLAAIAALYLLREAFGVRVPLPQARRQVPEWWRTFFSPEVAAFLYGLGLGIGWLTFVSFGSYVAVTAGAFLSGDPLLGLAIGAPFGLARAVSVTLNAGPPTPQRVARVVERLESIAATGHPRAANAVALTTVSVAAAAAAF